MDWFHELALKVATQLIRQFEGFYAHPYICPAGYATIGYGATYYPNGRRVRLSDPAITKEHAEEIMLYQVKALYLPAILKLCPGVGDPHRLAALIDFSFNLGIGNLQHSTLRRRVNAGAWEEVKKELRRWVRGGAKILKGLVIRREAECKLI